MEIMFALAFYGLFFWLVARFFGWLFKGPRYRRRKTRKNWDYTDWRISREAMRRARRGRW